MSDMVLWIAALAIGGGGLLLLGIAAAAAVALRSAGRRSHGGAAASSPPQAAASSSAASATATPVADRSEPDEGAAPPAGPESTWTPWAWLKACIFAIIHAGAVSFVLGGLTFFEDLVRANSEIRRTGNVSFPPQLLPPSLTSDPATRLLERGSGERRAGDDYQRYWAAAEELHERDLPPIETAEWKVVDILDEAGADGEHLAPGLLE